jgi:hypothetical protein
MNMPNEKNKWIDAVAKMIKLTQDGTLLWTAEPASESMKHDPDDRIMVVFRGSYKGTYLRLYRRTYKTTHPAMGILGALGSEETNWRSQVILDLVDRTGLILWTYPQVSPLDDLLSAVQYQAAGVKDFLDDLLSDSKEEG